MYLGFFGETPVREVIEKDGGFIGLTPEHPEHDNQRFDRAKFTDYVFMYQNLISKYLRRYGGKLKFRIQRLIYEPFPFLNKLRNGIKPHTTPILRRLIANANTLYSLIVFLTRWKGHYDRLDMLLQVVYPDNLKWSIGSV